MLKNLLVEEKDRPLTEADYRILLDEFVQAKIDETQAAEPSSAHIHNQYETEF